MIRRIAWSLALVLSPLSLQAQQGNDGPRGIKDITLKPLLNGVPATLPSTQPAAPKVAKPADVKITPAAEQLLSQLKAASAAIKSAEFSGSAIYEATIAGKTQRQEMPFTGSFLSPNLFRTELKGETVLASTGEKVYAFSVGSNSYAVGDAPKDKLGTESFQKLPNQVAKLLPVQNPAILFAAAGEPLTVLREFATDIDRTADVTIDAVACPAISFTLRDDKSQGTLVLDPKTHLVRRFVLDFKPVLVAKGVTDSSATLTLDYTAVKTDADLKDSAFTWAPPSAAREVTAKGAKPSAMADDDDDAAAALVGKPAPAFKLDDMAGKPVALDDLKGSVVVLDFWATWCGPCVAALPHLDKIYQDLQKDGLKVYALDQREAKDVVQKFITAKGLTIPVLLDVNAEAGKAYGVNGIPQTVVIGKDGLVKKVLIGFNPGGDEALRALLQDELKK